MKMRRDLPIQVLIVTMVTSCSTMALKHPACKVVIMWGDRCLILSGLLLILHNFDTDFTAKETPGYINSSLPI